MMGEQVKMKGVASGQKLMVMLHHIMDFFPCNSQTIEVALNGEDL